MDDTTTSTSYQPIAPRVWNSLQKLLAEETNPYLTQDRFVVQKDAFIRLADDDVNTDVPFVSYEHNEMIADETLDFSLHFFATHFALNIGPTAFTTHYLSFGFGTTEIRSLNEAQILASNPDIIARNILLCVKLLLNGQIAVGCTWREGRLLAAETFLMGYEAKPVPIALMGNFNFTDRAGQDYGVKQNKLISGHYKIAQDFPLLPPRIEDHQTYRGRIIDSVEGLDPLTKKQFDEIEAKIHRQEHVEQDKNFNTWGNFYQTVDFWLVAPVVIIIFLSLREAAFMPTQLRSNWTYPAYVIAAWLTIMIITSRLLSWRQVKINRGEQPLTWRLERWLSGLLSVLPRRKG